jgi:hypothetical protein
VCQREKRLGYLVTTQERSPKRIAFVAGISRESLRAALAIRDKPALATKARDLRGSKKGEVKRLLCGKLLLPVDSLGRIITTDSTFCAAEYETIVIRDDKTGKVEPIFCFHVWIQGCVPVHRTEGFGYLPNLSHDLRNTPH